MHLSRKAWVAPAIFLLALALRFTGAWHGLPNAITPDEPHHINVAVYFGTGDLNPHVFKYPTLWMYVLAFAYGLAFLAWSGFGLLHSTTDFASLFVTDPSIFYTTGRALAALFGAGACVFVYRTGRRLLSFPSALAAGLLCAVSPALVDYGHVAKADMQMLFFVSVAWWFAARYLESGTRRDAIGTSVAMGLAASTQYIAILMVPLLAWTHLLREEPLPERLRSLPRLIVPYLVLVIAFIAGSPFIALDASTFVKDLRDLQAFSVGDLTFERKILGFGVVRHYWRQAGPTALGVVLSGAGILALLRGQRRTLLFLTGPILWCGIYLGTRDLSAGPINYTFASALGILLLMGAAFEKMPGRAQIPVLTLTLLFPLSTSVINVRGWFFPDTRSEAQAWIEANIPAGSRLLVDQNHTMPRLTMDAGQAQRLLVRSQEARHPRRFYFEAILRSHPGGGYELIRLDRSPVELVTVRRLTNWSKEGYEELDVEEGVSALQKSGIDYVIRSDWGAQPDNSPRLRKYFEELEKMEVVKDFASRNPRYAPHLTIYRINPL